MRQGLGIVGLTLLFALGSSDTARSQIVDQQKISDSKGMLTLDDEDRFGSSVSSNLGDLDGDGVRDLAVGALNTDNLRGAVYILFLRSDGTVRSTYTIDDAELDFQLQGIGQFGSSLATLGDVDSDGVVDLAVGARSENGGEGGVWILFLNTDGSVKSFQRIREGEGGFPDTLEPNDNFGTVASGGDFDGDEVPDLLVGAPRHDAAGLDTGAVWILLLTSAGTVKESQKITSGVGGFLGDVDPGDEFGWDVATLTDLDGNGARDIAVSAFKDDDGGLDRGAIWILFLNTGLTVDGFQKISDLEGNF